VTFAGTTGKEVPSITLAKQVGCALKVTGDHLPPQGGGDTEKSNGFLMTSAEHLVQFYLSSIPLCETYFFCLVSILRPF
jgi:hypothetical protein